MSGYGMEQLRAALGIVPRIERQRRCVLRCFMAVGEVGFFLLQVAAVVEVRVGEDHGIDVGCLDRQRRPVAPTQLLVALKQPPIDQHL